MCRARVVALTSPALQTVSAASHPRVFAAVPIRAGRAPRPRAARPVRRPSRRADGRVHGCTGASRPAAAALRAVRAAAAGRHLLAGRKGGQPVRPGAPLAARRACNGQRSVRLESNSVRVPLLWHWSMPFVLELAIGSSACCLQRAASMGARLALLLARDFGPSALDIAAVQDAEGSRDQQGRRGSPRD